MRFQDNRDLWVVNICLISNRQTDEQAIELLLLHCSSSYPLQIHNHAAIKMILEKVLQTLKIFLFSNQCQKSIYFLKTHKSEMISQLDFLMIKTLILSSSFSCEIGLELQAGSAAVVQRCHNNWTSREGWRQERDIVWLGALCLMRKVTHGWFYASPC